jgi:hypothetical protein
MSNTDWASCICTQRSFTGSLIKLAGAAVAYKTQLQDTITTSSTESKFMAAYELGKMLLYLRSILWDTTFPKKLPVGSTKTIRPVQLWQTHKNLLVAPNIWTLGITSSVNGLSATSLSWSGLIPPLTKRTTSLKFYPASSSTGTLTTLWIMFHRNTPWHTNDPQANSTSLSSRSFPTHTHKKRQCHLSSQPIWMTYISQLLLGQHVYIPQTTAQLPTYFGQK